MEIISSLFLQATKESPEKRFTLNFEDLQPSKKAPRPRTKRFTLNFHDLYTKEDFKRINRDPPDAPNDHDTLQFRTPLADATRAGMFTINLPSQGTFLSKI